MKAETSMESRFIQTELESKLGRKCFLDSDDLRDLSDLTQHVRDSDVLARLRVKCRLPPPTGHTASVSYQSQLLHT